MGLSTHTIKICQKIGMKELNRCKGNKLLHIHAAPACNIINVLHRVRYENYDQDGDKIFAHGDMAEHKVGSFLAMKVK